MTLTVIAPPDALPVSHSDMKDYLRIGHTGEDDLVSALNLAATQRVESALSQVLVTQTLERTFDAWPKGLFGRGALLRPSPVSALQSVILSSDETGDEDVTGRFQVSADRLRLRPWSMTPPVPIGGQIAVRFDAGYGAEQDVPEDLKLAVKMIAAHDYSGRTLPLSSDALPSAVDDILSVYRRIRL
ncbi:MAG: hypothetical protein AAF829_11070 [Pseudomonadota bacterium]